MCKSRAAALRGRDQERGGAAAPVRVDVDRVLTAFRRQHSSELSWIRPVLEDVRCLGEPTLPALMVVVHAIRQHGDTGRQAKPPRTPCLT